MRKTVKVPQEVYDQLAEYSAEGGVTLQEAAAELLGGALGGTAEPEVIGPDEGYARPDDADRFDRLDEKLDRLGEGMARGFAGTYAGQQGLADQLGGDPDEIAEAQIAAVEGELPRRLADAYGRAARRALRDAPDTRRSK